MLTGVRCLRESQRYLNTSIPRSVTGVLNRYCVHVNVVMDTPRPPPTPHPRPPLPHLDTLRLSMQAGSIEAMCVDPRGGGVAVCGLGTGVFKTCVFPLPCRLLEERTLPTLPRLPTLPLRSPPTQKHTNNRFHTWGPGDRTGSRGVQLCAKKGIKIFCPVLSPPLCDPRSPSWC